MGGICSRSTSVEQVSCDVGPDTIGSAVNRQKTPNVANLGHSNFIRDNAGKITDHYQINFSNKIGEGSYGSVSKATNKETQEVRAVKTIQKVNVKNQERFMQEIAIMKVMDHPNIIKLYETFEDHRNIYLVMELCTGSELFDKIIEDGSFFEKAAATIMQQILRGVLYMHSNFIVHRDLKPENFLFQTKDSIEKSTLKIIDFGLSVKFEPGQTMSTKAGTPYYVSPQVLQGKYDKLCDIWSCGVIMFILLCGYPPFHGDSDQEVLSKVRKADLSFDPAHWKKISQPAMELITKMLVKDPKQRFDAQACLNHIWIKNKAPSAPSISLNTTSMMESLNRFRSANKLKKAALFVVARELNDDHVKELRNAFLAFDKNQDGTITLAELSEGLSKYSSELPEDIIDILKHIDSDGSGAIDYTEFLACTIDHKKVRKIESLWSAFTLFDKDGNGRISRAELANVLANDSISGETDTDVISAILNDVDKNGDGEIDFEEFQIMMGGK